jgi:hypothetical protein
LILRSFEAHCQDGETHTSLYEDFRPGGVTSKALTTGIDEVVYPTALVCGRASDYRVHLKKATPLQATSEVVNPQARKDYARAEHQHEHTHFDHFRSPQHDTTAMQVATIMS